MIISISDKLTVDNSANYIMSIRLRPDGFSFSAHDPSRNETFFYRTVDFERAKPYLSSLKEVFFENDFFSYLYKQIRVISVSSGYTLVPEAFYGDKQKTELLSFAFSSTGMRCLNNPWPDEPAQVVFGMDEEVYEFCSRSLLNPRFFHHTVAQLCLWKKQSRLLLPRQMYVILHAKFMDVACFAQGKLLFANSFDFERPDDILYYLLYIWKQTGFDQQRDQLKIGGEPALRATITKTLRTYLQYIDPLEIPSEAYLLGAEVVQAPLDLIALSICEL